MSQLSFQQRCASALTHPLTVSALAVLLLNDLLLKSLWPNPWTTGKLSDLAWIVFAPPLLAFLLSFVTRSRPLAERAVFAVAYIGLPILYAAFNTFGWLHDLILSGLLPFTGSAVGSPLDPTDSIVIPFALAIALWVWKQAGIGPERTRVRLSLFAAIVASLATVATSPSEISPSEWLVGIGSDGKVIMEGPFVDHYASDDGGLTWAAIPPAPTEDANIEWGGRQAETPRGTYTIQESGIILFGANGESREVYSTAYLRKGVNQWAQKYATQKIRADSSGLYENPQELVATEPINLVYDSRTGNVVVSTGIQGVLVGDSSETWRRVGVGDFKPTDLSFSGKARLLFSMLFWFGALSFSILFAVSAITLSEGRSRPLSQWRARLVGRVRRVAGILLAASIVLILVSFPFLFLLFELFLAALLAAVSSLVAFVLSLSRQRLSRKVVAIAFALFGTALSSGGFPPFRGDIDSFGINLDSLFAEAGLALSIIAVVLFLPRWRQLSAFALALASMVASITFLGLLWLTGGLAGLLVFFAGVVLLAVIAVFLLRHLRNENASQIKQADGGI